MRTGLGNMAIFLGAIRYPVWCCGKTIRAWLFLPFLFLASACAGVHSEAMQRFVHQMDMTVSQHENIGGYLKPTSGVTLENMQEVRSGVMEYFFKDKLVLFTSEEEKCRFIFVVEKDAGTIIDWKYNGRPENCLQSK